VGQKKEDEDDESPRVSPSSATRLVVQRTYPESILVFCTLKGAEHGEGAQTPEQMREEKNTHSRQGRLFCEKMNHHLLGFLEYMCRKGRPKRKMAEGQASNGYLCVE